MENDRPGQHQQRLQALSQLVWILDDQGQVQDWNAAWQNYIEGTERDTVDDSFSRREGYSIESVLERIHADDVERVKQYCSPQAGNGGGSTGLRDDAQASDGNNSLQGVEMRLRRFDGCYQWFWMQMVPVCGSDGRVVEWIGTFTNIESLKQQLQRSMAASQTIAPNAKFCTSDVRDDGHVADGRTVDGYAERSTETVSEFTQMPRSTSSELVLGSEPTAIEAAAIASPDLSDDVSNGLNQAAPSTTATSFQSVLMEAPAIICWLKGTDFIHQFANTYYRQFVGIDDVIGRPIAEVWPEAVEHGFLDQLHQVYRTNEPLVGNNVKVEFNAGRFGTRTAYFNFVHLPTHDHQGQVDGIFIHAVEVTEQNQARERLRRANVALSQFKTTLDLSVDSIFMFEPISLQFFYVNQGAIRQLGYSENQFFQMQLPDLIPKLEQERLNPILETLREGNLLSYTIETVFYTHEKQLLPVELFIQFVAPSGEQPRFVAIARNIQEQQRIEQYRRLMSESSTLFATSLNYETTLQRIAQLSVDYLADLCVIDVVREDGLFERVATAHSGPDLNLELVEKLRNYPPTLERHQAIRTALQTGEAQLISSISDEVQRAIAQNDEHFQILKQLSFQSAIVAPLMVQGRILGALSLITTQPSHTYDELDLVPAKDLARRAALAVENARLYRQAQDASNRLRRAIVVLGEQQQQLQTLQQLTNLLNQRLADLPELLQVMVRSIQEALPVAEFGLIVLHNEQTQQLEITAATGHNVERIHADQGFDVGQGWLGQVYSTGEPLLIQVAAAVDVTEDVQVPSALCAVPIESSHEGRLGVLAVGNWQNDRVFKPEDQKLLMAFGEQAAIALSNARLIQALEEREIQLAHQNELLAQQNAELEQHRQQIQEQNEQLQEVSRLKSQFLATMSHELRTPMNAVIGFSQLLLRQRQHPLQPAQLDMVQRILNNGKNLLSLINDILDLSKIEAGRLRLNLEEFNLSSLVESTAAELRSLATQKQLRLITQTYLADPYVINDRKRLRQIVVNLISNAIKFTEAGEVSIHLAQNEVTDTVILTVKDTGIGIDQKDLEAIFHEFRQADQTMTRHYSGTGLGLAISDWLVRIMDGQIEVESTLGQGSTFRVELPRRVLLDDSDLVPNQTVRPGELS